MGRTNQVLTGGSIYSTSPQTTTMKIVLALFVLCLFQFSLAELEDVDNAETNLVLERDIREAGKDCPKGKPCRRRQKKRKSRKSTKRGDKKQKSGKGRKLRQRSGKKASKKPSQDKMEKKVRKQKSMRRQGEARSSSKQRASGRQDTCFADLVAKTKKFNKAQVEFRLAKREESWGKLMKTVQVSKKPRKSKQSWRTAPLVPAITATRANWPPQSTRPLCLPAKTHWRHSPRTSRTASQSQVMQRYVPVHKA